MPMCFCMSQNGIIKGTTTQPMPSYVDARRSRKGYRAPDINFVAQFMEEAFFHQNAH